MAWRPWPLSKLPISQRQKDASRPQRIMVRRRLILCLKRLNLLVKFKNPFVVASGPPGATVERLVKAEDAGAAGVSVTLTCTKQPCYGRLRMYSNPGDASIVCHDRRLDMEEGFELVRKGKERTDLKLLANITHPSEDLEGWQTLAKGYEEAGADAIEMNLICPNITFSERRMGQGTDKSHGAVIGQHPEIIERVVGAVCEAVNIPVVVKLTPNVNDITVTAKAAEKAGASGIVMAGGQSGLPRVDLYDGGRPLGAYCADGYSFGSMGGPGIIYQSFALTAQLARALKVPVMAGGGLTTWEDGINFMMWGHSRDCLYSHDVGRLQRNQGYCRWHGALYERFRLQLLAGYYRVVSRI